MARPFSGHWKGVGGGEVRIALGSWKSADQREPIVKDGCDWEKLAELHGELLERAGFCRFAGRSLENPKMQGLAHALLGRLIRRDPPAAQCGKEWTEAERMVGG